MEEEVIQRINRKLIHSRISSRSKHQMVPLPRSKPIKLASCTIPEETSRHAFDRQISLLEAQALIILISELSKGRVCPVEKKGKSQHWSCDCHRTAIRT